MEGLKKYEVYVIQSECGHRYIGLTENLAKRLSQHNAGLSKWTKRYSGWKIIFLKNYLTLTEARKLENKLKKQKGGEGLNKLLKSLDP